jgi:pimeloyl-ACP methyl ester carboxylesterase
MRKLSICLVGFLLVTAADSALVDDIDLYSIDIGEGPAIVFVHAPLANLSTWDAQLGAFADDYRVLALDLPGHGLTESPPNGELSFEFFARAIEAVREEAGVEQIVLVGHGMGVVIIRQYVSLFPENVAALVAVEGSLDVRGREEMTLPDASNPPTREELEIRLRARNFVPETPVAVQVRVLELMMPQILSGSGEFVGIIRREIEETVKGGGFLRYANEVVEVPALHVFSESPEDSDTIREVVPNSRFETIPGTGHFPMMEKPREFNRILREFLESLDL